MRDLTSSSSRLLVTILLGNNVVNILGASVASGLAISLLGTELGIPVATFVMTLPVLLLREILRRRSRPGIRAVCPGSSVSRSTSSIRCSDGPRSIRPRDRAARASRDGGIEGDESLGSEEVLRLAREALDDVEDAGSPLAITGATSNAAEMDVSEIMVPRTEIEAYPTDTPVSDLIEQMLEDYTRVPIYEESIDQVLGVIHLKDLIKLHRAMARSSSASSSRCCAFPSASRSSGC